MNDETNPPPTSEFDQAVAAAQEKTRRIFAYARELSSLDLKPRTVQHKIDGIVYTSTKLPASVGLDVGPKVAALFGPSITRALAVGEGALFRVDWLTPLMDRAIRDDAMETVRTLLSRTKASRYVHMPGSKGGDLSPELDEHFAGEYPHLLKVCLLVLAHNFRGPTLGGR